MDSVRAARPVLLIPAFLALALPVRVLFAQSDGATILQVIRCVFTPGCRSRDLNDDGRVTAPDLTAAVRGTEDGPTISRYGVFEHTATWPSARYANPWEDVRAVMTLDSPSGDRVQVGGFYVGPDTWKARFAPAENGPWSWSLTIGDGTRSARAEGRFAVVDSDRPGFVRPNPVNPFRWVFDDGSPYYPLGIGDCINDTDGSGSPLDDWGFDGELRPPGTEQGRYVDMDTYLAAYRDAGVNLFRWSVANCAFALADRVDPAGNVYREQEGRFGDELVQALRRHGFRTYMVIFGFTPPFPTDSDDPDKMAAVERYVRYVVDRYGAYVDFWELMNEYPNPPATIDPEWYTRIGGYLRSIDPYRHPISTNWPIDGGGPPIIEITSPHWYQNESEFDSDRVTRSLSEQWKADGKPVVVGEQGNAEQNWDERSALRMRLRAWTALFREVVLVFWNTSFAKDYRGNGASNLYLGPEERAALRVLQAFAGGIDRRAQIVHGPEVSDPARVRAHALRSPGDYAAYLHAYTDHANPTTGIRLTVEPLAAGTATWLDPSTGAVLATVAVEAGRQTLEVPAFTIDVALRIGGAGTDFSPSNRATFP